MRPIIRSRINLISETMPATIISWSQTVSTLLAIEMRMKSQPRPLAKASARSAKAFRKSSPSRLREKSSSGKASTNAAAPRLMGGLLIQSLRLLTSSIPRSPCVLRSMGQHGMPSSEGLPRLRQCVLHRRHDRADRVGLLHPAERHSRGRALAIRRLHMRAGEDASDPEVAIKLQRGIDPVLRSSQPDVHDRQNRTLSLGQGQRFFRGRYRAQHLHARVTEGAFKIEGDEIIVLHDQDTRS